jgi:parallel beta-helix repeat protein
MKHILFLAALLVIGHRASAATTQPVEVSPQDSLAKALTTSRPVHLRLRTGTYVLTEPLKLTPGHYGSTIEAADGANPIISGGRRIGGWSKAKFNGHDCWVADVPGVKEKTWFFRELWIDGKRATRARSPNSGYFRIKESPDVKTWQDGVTRFIFDADNIPAAPFSYGAEVVAMNRWIENRLPIRDVDPNAKIVRFLRHSHFTLEPGDSYWLEGDARFFDEPCEWFLDRDAGKIYYLPTAGQEIEKVEAIAPVLSQLLLLAGDPDNKKFVDDVTIRGITFSHTQWSLPEVDPATTQPTQDAGFDQAAMPVPAAIRAEGARGCVIENVTVEHAGTWAIDFNRACARNRITRCTLTDLGAGGIKIGSPSISQRAEDQTFANEVTDCTIADGGHMFPSAVGVWIGQSYDNRIAHNHIHDFYYTGVSLGWSWGYGDSLNRGNIIEKNHIHHIGKRADGRAHAGPILSDMGGIYVLGGRNIDYVRLNHIHDISSVKYGGWGIYLDEGSSDVRVENNLVYRTTNGGFHLHYGKHNIVTNNIFAQGGERQLQFSREEEHRGFTFEHNIVYLTSGPVLNAPVTKVSFDYNLYGPLPAADLRFGDKTFEQWQGTGMDKHSIVADPTFADPANGNFTLKEPAMAKSIGFVPFDVSDAGVRPTR